MAFGQEVSVTAMQMAMAYGAVANGGNLMRPLLVRAVRNADGSPREIIQPELVRPVLRPEVARELRGLFRRVVTDGTGKKARDRAAASRGEDLHGAEVHPRGGRVQHPQVRRLVRRLRPLRRAAGALPRPAG